MPVLIAPITTRAMPMKKHGYVPKVTPVAKAGLAPAASSHGRAKGTTKAITIKTRPAGISFDFFAPIVASSIEQAARNSAVAVNPAGAQKGPGAANVFHLLFLHLC